jgi:hypothetical protein
VLNSGYVPSISRCPPLIVRLAMPPPAMNLRSDYTHVIAYARAQGVETELKDVRPDSPDTLYCVASAAEEQQEAAR